MCVTGTVLVQMTAEHSGGREECGQHDREHSVSVEHVKKPFLRIVHEQRRLPRRVCGNGSGSDLGPGTFANDRAAFFGDAANPS
jgi:hypothetical protein